MSDECVLLSPCTNRKQRLSAYERIKQFERKQGALEELKKIFKDAWFVTGEGVNKLDGDELKEYLEKRILILKGSKENLKSLKAVFLNECCW